MRGYEGVMIKARRRTGWCLLAAAISLASPSIAAEDVPPASDAMAFAIPAQPLEIALRAYGDAADVEVLYDARLVTGKRSAPLQGRYPPRIALDLLLRNTGLRPRYIGPHAITLTAVEGAHSMAIETIRVEARPSAAEIARFNAFAQLLLGRIARAIQHDPVAGRGSYEVTLRIWLDQEGAIIRSEVMNATSQSDGVKAAIAKAIHGLGANQPPPTNMPQPIAYRFQIRAPL
jgi:hypothetical protein